MGIDIPAAAVASILSEQKAWKADRIKRSSATSLHKRCVFVVLFVYEMEYIHYMVKNIRVQPQYK